MDKKKRREALPAPREETCWLGAPSEVPAAPSEKPLRRALAVGLLVALGALILSLFALFHYTPDGGTPPEAEKEEREGQAEQKIVFIREYDPDSGILTTPEIYGRCVDSAVSVYGEGGAYGGHASGFVFRSDGYIATAYRAIEGARRIFVTLSDGRCLEAKPVGEDALCDLALLRVEAEGLSAVRFGQTESLLVGERVLAIGASGSEEVLLGARSAAVSHSIARLGIRDGDSGLLQKKLTLWGLDRGWDLSWVGGPIFDEYGALVGMISAHRESEQGFALPTEGIEAVLEAFLSEEEASAELLAVLASPVARLGVLGERSASNGMVGVAIRGFSTGLCSAASMLKEGDLILRIDGTPVTAPEEIPPILERYAPGDTAMVSVLRHGQVLSFEVALLFLKEK